MKTSIMVAALAAMALGGANQAFAGEFQGSANLAPNGTVTGQATVTTGPVQTQIQVVVPPNGGQPQTSGTVIYKKNF